MSEILDHDPETEAMIREYIRIVCKVMWELDEDR